MINRKFLSMFLRATVVCCVGLSAGCYHVTVDTGLAPGYQTKTIWAHSFIYGLVPPSVVEAKAQCGNGIARVESQLGFVHQLVGLLTFAIYTPMQITVTCAAPEEASNVNLSDILMVSQESSEEQILRTFNEAVDLAA